MNPTFSFSAADAVRPVAASATTAAAAVNKSFLMLFAPGSDGCLLIPGRTPVRARPWGWSAVGHEHRAQGRGRGRPGGTARTRNQDENDDRGKIGQRRHQLRRDAEAERLSMQLKDRH